jgi:hypothetical protein
MEGSANDGLLKPRIWHWLTPNVRNPKTSTVVQKIGQKVTYITGLHNPTRLRWGATPPLEKYCTFINYESYVGLGGVNGADAICFIAYAQR